MMVAAVSRTSASLSSGSTSRATVTALWPSLVGISTDRLDSVRLTHELRHALKAGRDGRIGNAGVS
jgi:hypothetical protein